MVSATCFSLSLSSCRFVGPISLHPSIRLHLWQIQTLLAVIGYGCQPWNVVRAITLKKKEEQQEQKSRGKCVKMAYLNTFSAGFLFPAGCLALKRWGAVKADPSCPLLWFVLLLPGCLKENSGIFQSNGGQKHITCDFFFYKWLQYGVQPLAHQI